MANQYYKTDKVLLTAFVGGDSDGTAVQLDIIDVDTDYTYTTLTRKEAYELAINLLLRTSGLTKATNDVKNGLYLEDAKNDITGSD